MRLYSMSLLGALVLEGITLGGVQAQYTSANSAIRGATPFQLGGAYSGNSPYQNYYFEDAYAQSFGRLDKAVGRPHYEEGSLWSETSWFNSPHEFKPIADFDIGDIIVVEVKENFRTRDDIRMENEVESDLTFNVAGLWNNSLDRSLFGTNNGDIDYPNTNIAGDDEYQGESRFRQRSELTIEIPCTVRKILPDGRLLIEGRASRIIARERKHFLLSGMVDPEDVDPVERTVPSTRVAESQIRWEGKGPGQDTLKPGLVNRILDYIPLF
jgi:flagellar L-ring protein precursor FlgH